MDKEKPSGLPPGSENTEAVPSQSLPPQIVDVQNDINERVDVASQEITVGPVVDLHTTFISPYFLKQINSFPEHMRMEAVGITLEYLLLNPDGAHFWEFIQQLQNRFYSSNDLLAESVVRRVVQGDDNSGEARSAVMDYLKVHYMDHGYYFHGFNGVFESDIRERGLSAGRRSWDWEELRRIHEIFSRSGQELALGSAFLNSEGMLSYSASAKPLLNYALSSPEWFSIFARGGSQGAGFSASTGSAESRAFAFHRRDYKTARASVERLCSLLPVASKNEINGIINCFEKYWALFTSEKNRPKAALVQKRSLFFDTSEYEQCRDDWCDLISTIHGTETIIKMAGHFMHDSNNFQSRKDIPADKITLIDLPTYKDLFEDLV